jgi:hypothetical protein
MTKLMRLTSGRDIVDLRGYPGFPTAQEDTEGKYVFHALNSRAPSTTRALRGRAVEVTNAQAEEMLTHPTGAFEEVSAEVAERDRYRTTLTRDMFGVLRDPRTGAVVDVRDPEKLEPPAVMQVEPPGDPTPPEEVRASVRRELQDSGEGAMGTPEAGGKKAATK